MLSLDLSQLGRRAAAVLGAVATVSTAACSDDATAPPTPPPSPAGSAVEAPNPWFGLFVPHVIDGKITLGEYAGATSIPFRVWLPGNLGPTNAATYITHDDKYLYLATVFDRKSPIHPHDRVTYEFDNDGDGNPEKGDDILITAAILSPKVSHLGRDFYRENDGPTYYGTTSYYSPPWRLDMTSGGSTDVVSAWDTVGTRVVFETRHDLNSSDNSHDFSINPWTGPKTLGLQVSVAIEYDPVWSDRFVISFEPDMEKYCQLEIGTHWTDATCP